MHGRWPIAQEDYRYVLSAFVVAPTRFVDQWGWRRLTAHERMATASFYRELGHWMGIRDLNETYEGFARTFDDYEERHLAPSGHGRQLMALTQRVIAEQLPQVLRPVARPLAGRLTAALIDQRLATCLGLRPASSAERATARTLFELRGAIERRRPPRTDPSFTPGMPVIAHPDGYGIGRPRCRRRPATGAASQLTRSRRPAFARGDRFRARRFRAEAAHRFAARERMARASL